MNGNTELLNYIYQNSQMGVITLKQLSDITESGELKTCLESQLSKYQEINNTARSLLNSHGYDEKGINAFEKIRTYLMINIQTLTDKTPSHIAEMLIIGSNMGVINAVKNLKKYPHAEDSIINLMDKLLKFEENNIQELKAFLG
ncbi:MAG: hypothetical protein M0R40_11255 [Firmicutes bacterium]|nr:hypothetical protein [Bacillota bacterium]